MKKLRERQVSLRMALTMCAAAGAITAVICLISTGWNTNEVGKKLREIDRLVSDKYVGELDADNVADYAAAGYITGLGDKWSSYIPAENYEAYRMSGEGKGCGIGVSVTSTETSIRVTLVYDDSPAAKAGIEKGDYILGTGDLTTEKDGSSAVISAISGKEGTDVTVTVKKADGSAKELTMQRAVVTQKMAWGKMLNDKIGYIRIENFHDGCADQFKTALQSLTDSGAQSLVIDVRHNGGGRVKEMSAALDPLLGEGTIMTLRMKNGSETVYTSDADRIDLPIAVLIDDQSIERSLFRISDISHRSSPDKAWCCGIPGIPGRQGIYHEDHISLPCCVRKVRRPHQTPHLRSSLSEDLLLPFPLLLPDLDRNC